MGYLVQNFHQEPLCTWRTSLIFFISLVVIMMLEIVSIELDFASGFQKYMIHVVIGVKVFIKNLPVLGGLP